MKKNRNYFLFFISHFIFLFSCQNNFDTLVNENKSTTNDNFTVADAKNWFLETYGDISEAKESIPFNGKHRDINWKEGIQKRINTIHGIADVVIIPVRFKSSIDILENSSIWIIKDKNGIYSKYLDLYNSDYRKTGKKISKNQYRNDFKGSLNIYDIKNGLETGYYYEKGKIIGNILSFDGEYASFHKKNQTAKISWCYPVALCPDVNGSVTYLSSTGVITVTVGKCVTKFNCEQYFIYNGDPSFDDVYWEYYWQNVAEANRYVIRDIKNSDLTNPCLKSLTNHLINSSNTTNKLQNMVDDYYIQNGGDINLIFIENSNITVPGKFVGNSGTNVVNSTIQLNPNLISGNFEYGMSVLLHESIHAIMELKGLNMGTPDQSHERMMLSYFDILVEAQIEATGISLKDAGALTLNGLGSVYLSNPTLFNSKVNALNLTTQEIKSIADDYKKNSKGTPCN